MPVDDIIRTRIGVPLRRRANCTFVAFDEKRKIEIVHDIERKKRECLLRK